MKQRMALYIHKKFPSCM